MCQAGVVGGNYAGVQFGPECIIEISVGPLVRIDVIAAVGKREPLALVSDDETRAVAFALNVERHHIR